MQQTSDPIVIIVGGFMILMAIGCVVAFALGIRGGFVRGQVWYWWRLLPYLIGRRTRRGDDMGALHLIERILRGRTVQAAPVVACTVFRQQASVLRRLHREEEALQVLRSLATDIVARAPASSAPYVAEIRHEAAECLRTLGRPAAAREERLLALEALDGMKRGTATATSEARRGRLLHVEQRYKEASAAFTAALELLPTKHLPAALSFLLEYADALYRSHQYALCLEIAAEMIRWGETGERLLMAYRLAGCAARQLCDTSLARTWFEREAEEALRQGNVHYQMLSALDLTRLSLLAANAGAAEQHLTRAETMAVTDTDRLSVLRMRAASRTFWGDIAEAAAITTAADAQSATLPEDQRAADRTISVMTRLWLASIEEAPSKALALLDAAPDLSPDSEPNALEIQALRVWADAAVTPCEETARAVADLGPRIAAAADSHPEWGMEIKDAFYLLSKAALCVGDGNLGLQYAEAYRRFSYGAPILAPDYWYLVGECHAGAGNEAAAHAAWQKAVALGIDTLAARKAAQRLEGALPQR